MGRNVFVSYKYWDNNVAYLHNYSTWYPKVRDYVDFIENELKCHSNHNYKGEHDNEDLSDKNETYIWDKLKDHIFSSSITVVLISPNMREIGKWDKSQWIPWEIAYSLRETTRNDRTSKTNAIVAVILPDRNGSYSYYANIKLFNILEENIRNKYVYVVNWDNFIKDMDQCFHKAEVLKIMANKNVIRKVV